jgi:hypothetical protein
VLCVRVCAVVALLCTCVCDVTPRLLVLLSAGVGLQFFHTLCAHHHGGLVLAQIILMLCYVKDLMVTVKRAELRHGTRARREQAKPGDVAQQGSTAAATTAAHKGNKTEKQAEGKED